MPTTISGDTGVSAVQNGVVDLTTDVSGVLPSANGGTGTATANTSFKNRIINGAMAISQRNGTSSITATDGSFGVDRFKTAIVGSGVFTMQQSSTAATGFSFSQLLTVTTADSSIAATDEYSYRHFIEGFNFADMMWGTANAQTVTLSFWVRSSVTGTYAVGLRNDAANRTYPATYTISAANTWEQKTITIAGDTTGTWVGATNGIGVGIIFSLGAGSNYQGTANAWNNGNVWSASSATQWISTNGATFYLTGVQLEKGSTATSFDYRPYGTELALCQRYYLGTEVSVGNYFYTCLLRPDGYRLARYFYPVEMRTAATATLTWNSDGSGVSYSSVIQTKQFFQCLSASPIATSTVVPYITAFSASAEL